MSSGGKVTERYMLSLSFSINTSIAIIAISFLKSSTFGVYDRLWHGMWIEEHSRLRGTLWGA